MLKVIYVIMFTFTHTTDIAQTKMKLCDGVNQYSIRGNIDVCFLFGGLEFLGSNRQIKIHQLLHKCALRNLNVYRKVVGYRYQNRASFIGGKQRDMCLKMQLSVPTPTLSVFVNSIVYNFGLVTCIASIFALA